MQKCVPYRYIGALGEADRTLRRMGLGESVINP